MRRLAPLVVWLAPLVACGPGSPATEAAPEFEPWLDAALARCHADAVREVTCLEGRCIAVIRMDDDGEPDLKGCMAWPYIGMGRRKRVLECGEHTYKLTAVSQLPELDVNTSREVLQAEAALVGDLIDAVECPE